MDMAALEFGIVYILGALGYGAIELLWRGRTHWTMLVLGGLCFLLMHLIVTRIRARLIFKWLLCALAVTALEFGSGCLLNLALGWGVWDYSGAPGNLLGQVCPAYALAWLGLSVPCSGVSLALRRWLFSG